MRISLTPRTSEFFTLFGRAGENALEVARLVERRFREHPSSGVTQEQVKKEETEGDAITRELITLLNTQYLTPFDREDIYLLATEIDDVVDYLEEASDLLGLYDGVPLTERDSGYTFREPDRILIFRGPLLDMCSSEEQLVDEVRITVVHEIAHHFGIDDQALHRLGYG